MEGIDRAGAVPTRSIGQLDLRSLEGEIRQLVSEVKAPGLSLSLQLGDQVADLAVGSRWAAPAKPMSANTRFPSACVIKPLIALLACELHARSELDLNRAVADYLPDLDSGRSNHAPITLAHLISHTAGYVEPQGDDVRWGMDFESFAEAFRSVEQAFTPGTVWGYTQTGLAVAGKVIEKVTGEDPLDIIRRELLAPIDVELRADFQDVSADVAAAHALTNIGYRPIKLPNESPLLRHSISALTLRASDLLKIGGILGGSVRPQLISAEAYKVFSTPIIDVPLMSGGGRKEITPTRYGHGRALYGDLVGQAGSYVGLTNTLRVDPATGASVALCVAGWMPGLRDYVVSHSLRRLTGNEAIVPTTRCRIDRPIGLWAGAYKGLMLGGGTAQLDLTAEGKLHCVIRMKNQPDAEATLWADEHGFIRGKINLPHLAIALHYSDENDAPCFMAGSIAYAREASAK